MKSTGPRLLNLFRQFPTAVGKLAAGEHITPVLLSRCWFHDPIFDPFARHTLPRRFAQKLDRAGVPTLRVTPASNGLGALSVDLALNRTADDRTILNGQWGYFVPGLCKSLGLSRSALYRRLATHGL